MLGSEKAVHVLAKRREWDRAPLRRSGALWSPVEQGGIVGYVGRPPQGFNRPFRRYLLSGQHGHRLAQYIAERLDEALILLWGANGDPDTVSEPWPAARKVPNRDLSVE